MPQELVAVERLDAWVRRFGDLVAEQRAHLTDLDSAIGDADHGINMDRGMRAVCEKLDTARPGTADELFKAVGMTLVAASWSSPGPCRRPSSGCAGTGVVELLAHRARPHQVVDAVVGIPDGESRSVLRAPAR